MRSEKDLRNLRGRKDLSRLFTVSYTVLDTPGQSREYFRYQDGRLCEYDRTMANGKQIHLTDEEKDGIDEFFGMVGSVLVQGEGATS